MRNTTNGKIKTGTEELSNVNSSNIKQVKVDGSSVKYTTDNITWKEVGSGSAFVINGTVSGETISITETASKIIEAFNKKMIMILHVVEFSIVLDEASFDNISNTYSFSNYNLEKTALGVMSKKVAININENGVVSGFYHIEPLVFETQPILYGVSPSLNEIEFNKHLLYQNNGELSYLEKELPATTTPIELTSSFNGSSWYNSVYYENFVYRIDGNKILRKINVLTYQKEEYTLPTGSYYALPCAHNGFIYAPSPYTKQLLIFNIKDNSYTETDSAFAYDCRFSFYYDNKIYSNLGVYDLTTKTFSALPSFLPKCYGEYKSIYTFFNNGKLWYIVNDTYYVINMETQVVEKEVIYASSPSNIYSYWANVGDYMYRISKDASQLTISKSSLHSDNFVKSFEEICSVVSSYDSVIIGTSDALFFNAYKVPLYVYVLKTLGLKV